MCIVAQDHSADTACEVNATGVDVCDTQSQNVAHTTSGKTFFGRLFLKFLPVFDTNPNLLVIV